MITDIKNIGRSFWLAAWLASPSLLANELDLPPSELGGASEEVSKAAQKATTSSDASEVVSALDELRRLAAADPNDHLAALALGHCEEHGLGTAKSLDAAKASYKLAAEGGSVAGMRRYGRLLRTRTATSAPDYAAAREWLGKADAAGDAGAALELGRMDFAGEGMERPDPDKARFFLGKAAEAGSTEAMVELGRALKRGAFESRPAFEEAMRWFQRAASNGDARGTLEEGFLYEEGAGVKMDVDHALALYRAAAEQKLPEALVHLGLCALQGVGGEKDERAALEWFRQGAEANSAVAMFNLATFYESGRAGLGQDASKALEWYRKAAELGHAHSQYQLARRYRDGRGVKADPAGAFKWLSAAAAQRFPAAMVDLGALYEKGFPNIVRRDFVVAARLYTEAAKQNHPGGQFLLARLFAQGKGVNKDSVAAYVLAAESARRGYKAAGGLRDALAKQLTPEQLKTAETRLEQARQPGRE